MNRKWTVLHLLCSLILTTGILLGIGSSETHAAEKAAIARPIVEVVARGAPIHASNGVFFDSEDHLFIASVLGREITVMNRNTGKILAQLGPELGVEGPDDITFGPDGSLYWTSLLTGHVGRLTPEGEFTQQYVAHGVNAITFTDTEPYRLFVALDFLGDALYEVDPELVDPPTLLIENLGNLNAMDFGPDGYLYGPLFFANQVVRIDVDECTVTTLADGFDTPVAVKFNSQGELYALESYLGDVYRIDTDTGAKELIVTLPTGLDNLAFDSDDRMFVSNTLDGAIYEVTGSSYDVVSPGGMIAPGGVAVMANERGGMSVYVGDTMCLREFDAETGEEVSFAPASWNEEHLGMPYTVFPDGSNLLLSSIFSNRVQVWDPGTQEVIENYLDFFYPMNAIRFQGEIVVAELGTGSVVRESDREPLISGLYVPIGLAATEEDLWVTDWATGMVWQAGNSDPVATGLSYPEGLAVDTDGSLLVVETGTKRLSRIDPTTGDVTTVVEGLKIALEAGPDSHPTWSFNGVCVCPEGDIYITGDVKNVLCRIDR